MIESTIPLIDKLLEALCETEKVKVCIDGVKIDTGIAVAGTLLGTAVGGPVGGVVGIWPFDCFCLFIFITLVIVFFIVIVYRKRSRHHNPSNKV